MKATWTGLLACGLVLYYGVIHSASNPGVLLNPHALILVIGGTLAIGFLTYPVSRLSATLDFVIFGFLFRMKKEEVSVARDIISCVDNHYKMFPTFETSSKPHPFLREMNDLLGNSAVSADDMETILVDRRNAIKRRYLDDAKTLNNLAKYPPHLGLMGAASGMIEMMSQLGKSGTETIGASLAIALGATLWGVGLNNFIFLPLADNSTKAAEDEIYLRDIIIECGVYMKRNGSYRMAIQTCLNRLAIEDRVNLKKEYNDLLRQRRMPNVA